MTKRTAAQAVTAPMLAIALGSYHGTLTETLYALAGAYGMVLVILVTTLVRRWDYNRKAPQRAADSRARLRHAMSRYAAPGESLYAADFNFDGPYTVAGQPR